MRLVNFFLLLLIWGEPALAADFFPKPALLKIGAPQKNWEEAYQYGFNGQMKDNEIAGVGNHNSALFWEYDTRTGRRWNQDPVTHPWESPYATFGDNPIWHSDPLGNDWYKDAKKNVMFDPNIQGSKDLKDGQTYIGKSFSEKTKSGSADYRKDGSIMYSNQTDAYNRMTNAAQVPGGGTKSREEMGVIMDKGVLVLPDYKNNSTTSGAEEYGYKFINGHLYDPVSNNEHGLLGTIHTHLLDMHDNGASAGPSLEDVRKFTTETPNKPFMTMGYDGNVHAAMGNKTGYNAIQLPKGYSTVRDLQKGADLKGLLKSNEK